MTTVSNSDYRSYYSNKTTNEEWLREYDTFLQEETEMGLHAKDSGGGDFEITPAGTHLGRCYMVIDLGLQEITYEGAKKLQHKVLIGWELPKELMADGRPFAISKRYTLSTNKNATLTEHLTSWRGRPFTDEERESFDITKVLGAPALVTVTHDTRDNKTYSNVSSVTKVMKDMAVPDAVNPPISFSFETDTSPSEKVPEWIRNVIAKCVYKSWEDYEAHNATLKDSRGSKSNEPPSDFDDDIPF